MLGNFPTFTTPPMPDQALFGGNALPQTAPTAATTPMGAVGFSGMLPVLVDTNCALTLYLWSAIAQRWFLPGASTQYTQTFAGSPNLQYFTAEPGTLFYLVSNAANVHGWFNGKAPQTFPIGPQANVN